MRRADHVQPASDTSTSVLTCKKVVSDGNTATGAKYEAHTFNNLVELRPTF
jgi:hypothetical protein